MSSTALLGRLQHRVESTQHGHRQDDIAVLAAHVEVAQDVVGDAPDEVGDPADVGGTGIGAQARPAALLIEQARPPAARSLRLERPRDLVMPPMGVSKMSSWSSALSVWALEA